MSERDHPNDLAHRRRMHAQAERFRLTLDPDAISHKVGEHRAGDETTTYAMIHAADLVVADRKGRMLLIGRREPPLGLAPIGEMLETRPDGRPETALEAARRGAKEEASLDLPDRATTLLVRPRTISEAAIRRVRDKPNPAFVAKYGLKPGDYFSVTTVINCILVDDLDQLSFAPASDAKQLVLVQYDPSTRTLRQTARVGADGRREPLDGGKILAREDFAIPDLHDAVMLTREKLAKTTPAFRHIPVGNTGCTVHRVSFLEAFAVNAFFASLYRAEAEAASDASRDELAARLGLLARKPIVGLFKHIDTAAVVLCGLSPILKHLPFGISDPRTDRLLDYHGYIVKDPKGRIAAIATFERNPDPRMLVDGAPRGSDDTRVEASLWVLPKSLRRAYGMPGSFTSALGKTLGGIAQSLGYQTVEAVISRGNKPSQYLARSLGLRPTNHVKSDPALGERVVYQTRLGTEAVPAVAPAHAEGIPEARAAVTRRPWIAAGGAVAVTLALAAGAHTFHAVTHKGAEARAVVAPSAPDPSFGPSSVPPAAVPPATPTSMEAASAGPAAPVLDALTGLTESSTAPDPSSPTVSDAGVPFPEGQAACPAVNDSTNARHVTFVENARIGDWTFSIATNGVEWSVPLLDRSPWGVQLDVPGLPAGMSDAERTIAQAYVDEAVNPAYEQANAEGSRSDPARLAATIRANARAAGLCVS